MAELRGEEFAIIGSAPTAYKDWFDWSEGAYHKMNAVVTMQGRLVA